MDSKGNSTQIDYFYLGIVSVWGRLCGPYLFQDLHNLSVRYLKNNITAARISLAFFAHAAPQKNGSAGADTVAPSSRPHNPLCD